MLVAPSRFHRVLPSKQRHLKTSTCEPWPTHSLPTTHLGSEESSLHWSTDQAIDRVSRLLIPELDAGGDKVGGLGQTSSNVKASLTRSTLT